VHEVIERAERLVDRRVRIDFMDEIQIEPIGPQPAEARVDLPEDVEPREPALVRARPDGIEDLRAHDDAVAHRGPFRVEPVADERLTASAAVGVSRVEHVDAGVPGAIHQGMCLRLGLPHPVERRRRSHAAEVAAAEDQPRDGDTG